MDSTNAEARRRVEGGEVGPLWIAADRQLEGRGRRGRGWTSGVGDLTATLLLTAKIAPAEAAGLSFVAALAASDVVADYAPPGEVRVKWPNDVLIGAEKVCGVLIESGGAGEGRLWVAIGIGMNLISAPEGLERPAAALGARLRLDRLRPPTPNEALFALDLALRRWLETWRSEGLQAVLTAWTARAYGLPGPCLARLPDVALEGWAEGLDCDGALRLRLPGGMVRRITAGEVFFPARGDLQGGR